MVVGISLKILDPTLDFEREGVSLAQRLNTLDGKVVGLYSNNKLNATRLLDMIGNMLSERFEIKDIVRGKYNGGRVMRRDEWQDIERCDAIVLSNGD